MASTSWDDKPDAGQAEGNGQITTPYNSYQWRIKVRLQFTPLNY